MRSRLMLWFIFCNNRQHLAPIVLEGGGGRKDGGGGRSSGVPTVRSPTQAGPLRSRPLLAASPWVSACSVAFPTWWAPLCHLDFSRLRGYYGLRGNLHERVFCTRLLAWSGGRGRHIPPVHNVFVKPPIRYGGGGGGIRFSL